MAGNAAIHAGQNKPYGIEIFVPRGATIVPRYYNGECARGPPIRAVDYSLRTNGCGTVELSRAALELRSLWSLFPPATDSADAD